MTTKLVHAFRDDDGMESRVWKSDEHEWFSVTLCDLDSGKTLPQSRRYPFEEAESKAVDYAKSLVGET